jgi:hypothetical protein
MKPQKVGRSPTSLARFEDAINSYRRFEALAKEMALKPDDKALREKYYKSLQILEGDVLRWLEDVVK